MESEGSEPGSEGHQPPNDPVHQLRTDWRFAGVIQFCRVFGAALKLRPFPADQLEAALLQPQEHSVFLQELSRLDRSWRTLGLAAHPLGDTGDFFLLTPSQRLAVLYALCDWRVLEDPVVREATKLQSADGVDHPADALRDEPLGEDAKGNLYYFFSTAGEDCWLYQMEPPRKRIAKRQRLTSGEALWEPVCTTLEELADFIQRLSTSRNREEKRLHDELVEDIQPMLLETAGARRKAEERAAAMEAVPKKRSSRLQVLALKKEEEEKRRREEDAERARIAADQERQRKDREREARLKARLDEEERVRQETLALQRKLAGIVPGGPSREERLQRRMVQLESGAWEQCEDGTRSASPAAPCKEEVPRGVAAEMPQPAPDAGVPPAGMLKAEHPKAEQPAAFLPGFALPPAPSPPPANPVEPRLDNAAAPHSPASLPGSPAEPGSGADVEDLALGLGLLDDDEGPPPARQLRPRRAGPTSAAVLAELSEDDFEAELEAEERAANNAAAAAAAHAPQSGRQATRRAAAAAAADTAAAAAGAGDPAAEGGAPERPRPRTRKRARSPGWNPLGPRVPKRACARAAQPRRSYAGWARRFGAAPASAPAPALARAAKPRPPPEPMPEPSEESDLGEEEEESLRASSRRARKRVEDDDPDYEVGEEEQEHLRVRPSRSRHGGSSRSGGYGGHNELSELRDQWAQEEDAPVRPRGTHGGGSSGGAHMGATDAMAGAPPFLHAPHLMQHGLPRGLSAEQLAMLEAQAAHAAAMQRAQQQHLLQQQQQVAQQLISTLSVEQRDALSRLPPQRQAQILQNLRDKQMEMQRQQHAARQAMLHALRPEEVATLQQMPPAQQQAALAQLTQRYMAQMAARQQQAQAASQAQVYQQAQQQAQAQQQGQAFPGGQFHSGFPHAGQQQQWAGAQQYWAGAQHMAGMQPHPAGMVPAQPPEAQQPRAGMDSEAAARLEQHLRMRLPGMPGSMPSSMPSSMPEAASAGAPSAPPAWHLQPGTHSGLYPMAQGALNPGAHPAAQGAQQALVALAADGRRDAAA
ncbi:hypothetical protein WJX81_001990 [Elliptochloris bilobata]|uniref:WHIM1 domain-containing protein n=1 Tax=Elliptochloris bilobata TaxID=381761 RepID=A0AAW1SAZ5_9CHLO